MARRYSQEAKGLCAAQREAVRKTASAAADGGSGSRAIDADEERVGDQATPVREDGLRLPEERINLVSVVISRISCQYFFICS